MTYLPVVTVLLALALSVLPPVATAQTSSSASFRLPAQALTSEGGTAGSASFRVSDCIAPESEAPGKSTSASFILYAGCPAAMPAGLANDDDDGDGVDNGVEEGAPNDGDGNADGTPDLVQGHVTSVTAPGSGAYLTIVACADAGCMATCQLRDVYTVAEANLPVQDPDLTFPFGLLGFTTDCPTVFVKVLYHSLNAFNPDVVYEKFGPNPPGSMPSIYYTLPGVIFGSEAVGPDPAVATASFTLVDGGTGDATVADGEIIDPGGPAFALPEAPAPALGLTGMAIALALIGAIGGLAIRRRRVDR